MKIDPRAARNTLFSLFAEEYMTRFPAADYYMAVDWSNNELLNMQDSEVCEWVKDILAGHLVVSSRYNDYSEISACLDAA
jgi:hypothetical protein